MTAYGEVCPVRIEHCYHEIGLIMVGYTEKNTYRLIPPLVKERCCWCGQEREAVRMSKPLLTQHGDYNGAYE